MRVVAGDVWQSKGSADRRVRIFSVYPGAVLYLPVESTVTQPLEKVPADFRAAFQPSMEAIRNSSLEQLDLANERGASLAWIALAFDVTTAGPKEVDPDEFLRRQIEYATLANSNLLLTMGECAFCDVPSPSFMILRNAAGRVASVWRSCETCSKELHQKMLEAHDDVKKRAGVDEVGAANLEMYLAAKSVVDRAIQEWKKRTDGSKRLQEQDEGTE